MIVILEGVNGAGKTTVANEFVKLGFTRLKPFLSDDRRHWDTEQEARATLSRNGIPTNTFVEDMFVAEVLSQMPSADVILDRSLPSALVYGLSDGSVKDDAHASDLLETWLRSFEQAKTQVVYAWLDVSSRQAQRRSSRASTESVAWQALSYGHYYERVKERMPALYLPTGHLSPIEVANKIRTYATSLLGAKK